MGWRAAAGGAAGGPAGGPAGGGKGGRAVVVRGAAVLLILAAAAGFLAARESRFLAEARDIVAVRFLVENAGLGDGGEGEGHPEVTVEVAVSRAERERGLIGRAGLAPATGMLFVYRDEKPRRFTTEGMSFAIDIITLATDGVVTGILTRSPGAPPLDTPPARYVLEVPAGWAAAHGVAPGTRAVLLRRGGPQ